MEERLPTYGFIGSGDTTAKNTLALLEDLVETDPDNPPTFIIPVTNTLWTTPIQTIADFAYDAGVAYEVVTDDSADSHKAFAEILDSAVKVHRVQKVAMKVEAILERSDGPVLIVAWSDEDGESLSALQRALTHDIPAYDLCNGLEPLELDDGEDAPEPPEMVDAEETDDEVFDGIANEGDIAGESSTEDDQSQEDEMTTTHAHRQVPFPLATPLAAHPEDFESAYSIDLDPDELLTKAMDVLCDRVAARVLSIMVPRMEAIERSVKTLGGIISEVPTQAVGNGSTAAPSRTRSSAPASRTGAARTAATEKSSPRKPRAEAKPADEQPKRPGRPRLPRDENGKIIRPK